MRTGASPTCRCTAGSASAAARTDMRQLVADLEKELEQAYRSAIDDLRDAIRLFPALSAILSEALVENPPVVLRDGGVIADGYDDDWRERHTLADGARILLRPVHPSDSERVAEGFARLSPESRYLRCLQAWTWRT